MIVVVTTYSGSLVAFLTFPDIDNPMNNLEDLLNADISWGTLQGTSFTDYLKVNN